MGAFLEKPQTDKETERGEGAGLRFGVSAMQGWRKEMEDRHVCNTSISQLKDHAFFGVFDGHAGNDVSEYCSEHLLNCISSCLTDPEAGKQSPESIKAALHKGFLTLDDRMHHSPLWANDENRGGSTAITVWVTPDKFIFGNCGDSRGLLCRDGQVVFATEDHKPVNPKERGRIERAGGSVMMQRVNGSLAVSRALGDFAFKRNTELKATEQLVSPEPEITIVDRDPERDEFLLLACDGVYDVMTNEAVVAYVRHRLTLTDKLEEVCSKLIDTCLNKDSRDNMSVILITFPAAPKVSQEAIEKEDKLDKEAKEAILAQLKKRVEESTDPLDLEERYLAEQIANELPDEYAVFDRRAYLGERLEELKKEKFGAQMDFSFNGPSDSSEAPDDYIFSVGNNKILLTADTAADRPPPSLDSSPPPVLPQPADDLPSPVQTDSVDHTSKNT